MKKKINKTIFFHKLFLNGKNGSLAITLPRQWCKDNVLEKGDTLIIDANQDHLIIRRHNCEYTDKNTKQDTKEEIKKEVPKN